jgi:hypothetical protein
MRCRYASPFPTASDQGNVRHVCYKIVTLILNYPAMDGKIPCQSLAETTRPGNPARPQQGRLSSAGCCTTRLRYCRHIRNPQCQPTILRMLSSCRRLPTRRTTPPILLFPVNRLTAAHCFHIRRARNISCDHFTRQNLSIRFLSGPSSQNGQYWPR